MLKSVRWAWPWSLSRMLSGFRSLHKWSKGLVPVRSNEMKGLTYEQYSFYEDTARPRRLPPHRIGHKLQASYQGDPGGIVYHLQSLDPKPETDNRHPGKRTASWQSVHSRFVLRAFVQRWCFRRHAFGYNEFCWCILGQRVVSILCVAPHALYQTPPFQQIAEGQNETSPLRREGQGLTMSGGIWGVDLVAYLHYSNLVSFLDSI